MPAAKKLTLSPTKINAYLHCPRFYWYLYHKKYRRRPHGALSLGATLHRSLEIIHAGPERPSVEELIRHFQTTWSGAGFATPEDEQAQFAAGQAMLERYLAEAPPVEEHPATLLQEKMVRMDRGFYILTGRVDRVDEWPDGSLDIVDYKSGRSTVTEEQVLSDIGLMVYETIVRSLFPDRPVRVAIHALRPNLRVTIQRDQHQVAEVAAFLDETARLIEHDTLWSGVNTVECCTGCDFERFCPDWKGPVS